MAVPSWLADKPKWAIGAVPLLLILLLGSYTYPLLGSMGYRNLAVRSMSVAVTTDDPSLLAQADAYAEQALSYNPRLTGQLAYRMGIGYQQLGLADEAIANYQKALQTDNLSGVVFGDLLFRLAVYLRERDGVAAAQYFRQVLEIEAGEVPAQTVAYADVYLVLLMPKEGRDLLLEREYLEQALANWSDAFTMDNYLGLIMRMRQQGGEEYLDQALEMAITATRRQGSNTWTALARCNVHLDRQEFDEAIKWCERSRNLDRKNHHAHVWLGIAYEKASRWEDALAEFELAASLTTDNGWYLTLIQEVQHKLAKGTPTEK